MGGARYAAPRMVWEPEKPELLQEGPQPEKPEPLQEGPQPEKLELPKEGLQPEKPEPPQEGPQPEKPEPLQAWVRQSTQGRAGLQPGKAGQCGKPGGEVWNERRRKRPEP